MYVGHFAIGMALKAKYPDVPTLPILLGVGFLDILDGLFVILGWNLVTPNPQALPYLYFDLTFIDWDHSLLTAIFWSLVWAAFFLKDKRVAVIAGIACFSHFLADWPMHNSDLALYPYADFHLGMGLWGKLGVGSWLLEGVFSAALIYYAYSAFGRRGVDLRWPCVLLAVMFLQLSPWTSPMKFIANLAEPTAHLALGALVAIGFLLPGLILCALVDRAQRRARSD